MNTILTNIKTHAWKILTIIFALLFLGKGCTHNKIIQVDKKFSSSQEELKLKIDSISQQINKTATHKQVRDEMEKVMFDFLIYEDDLDKGKINLSAIKNKIESND